MTDFKPRKIVFPLFEMVPDPIIGWRKCHICNKQFSISDFEKHEEEMKDDPLHSMIEVMNS
jgi:hypothetical protein